MALLAKKNNILFIVVTLALVASVVFGGVGEVGVDGENTVDSDAVHFDNGQCHGLCNSDDGIGNPPTKVGENCYCGFPNPIQDDNITDFINRILNYLAFATGTLAVSAIIIAGILYIVSGAGGKTDLKSKAKGIIKYTILGFVLVLSARGIVALINILII